MCFIWNKSGKMENGKHVKNYIKWLEKHKGTCGSHSKVRPNYAEIPGMCLEWSGRVRTHRNRWKAWESIGRLRKTLEGAGNHQKLWKTSEAAEIVGRCGKMSEASERVAGDREDFQKACVTDQVMSQYVTSCHIRETNIFSSCSW